MTLLLSVPGNTNEGKGDGYGFTGHSTTCVPRITTSLRQPNEMFCTDLWGLDCTRACTIVGGRGRGGRGLPPLSQSQTHALDNPTFLPTVRVSSQIVRTAVSRKKMKPSRILLDIKKKRAVPGATLADKIVYVCYSLQSPNGYCIFVQKRCTRGRIILSQLCMCTCFEPNARIVVTRLHHDQVLVYVIDTGFKSRLLPLCNPPPPRPSRSPPKS